MIKLICDLDGVAINNLSKSYWTDCIIIGDENKPLPSIDEYRRALKNTNWKEFYGYFGIQNVEEAIKKYYRLFPNEEEVIPGVIEFFEEIKNPRAIVSKFEMKERLLERLERLGLREFFSATNIHAVRGSKVEAIVKEAKGYKAYFVGDTVDDIIDAKEAGVISVAVSADTSYNLHEDLVEANPDIIVKHISELMPICK